MFKSTINVFDLISHKKSQQEKWFQWMMNWWWWWPILSWGATCGCIRLATDQETFDWLNQFNSFKKKLQQENNSSWMIVLSWGATCG